MKGVSIVEEILRSSIPPSISFTWLRISFRNSGASRSRWSSDNGDCGFLRAPVLPAHSRNLLSSSPTSTLVTLKSSRGSSLSAAYKLFSFLFTTAQRVEMQSVVDERVAMPCLGPVSGIEGPRLGICRRLSKVFYIAHGRPVWKCRRMVQWQPQRGFCWGMSAME